MNAVLRATDGRGISVIVNEFGEAGDVVALNKMADATQEHIDAARKIIRSLNAEARIIETSHSDVPANAIPGTGLFNSEKAHDKFSFPPRCTRC